MDIDAIRNALALIYGPGDQQAQLGEHMRGQIETVLEAVPELLERIAHLEAAAPQWMVDDHGGQEDEATGK